jgi:hypothetical protein
MNHEKNISLEEILKWCLEHPCPGVRPGSTASEWSKEYKKILWWWRNHPRPVVPLDDNDPARLDLARRLLRQKEEISYQRGLLSGNRDSDGSLIRARDEDGKMIGI